MTSSAATASPRLQSASGSKLVAMSSPARADKTLPPSERSAAAMNAADSNAKQARQQSIGSNYCPSILTRASGSVRCGKYRSHRSSRALCCLASWLPASHQEQPRRAKQTTIRMLLHNPEMRALKPHVISERACHFLLINLISLIALLAALGEPIVCIQNSVLNSHNQLQLQQQQQQQQSQQQQTQLHQQRTDLDKQLLRKAFDGDQTSVSREPRSEGPRTEPAAARQDNQAFQCPEQFGYYTDTRDCTKYYVCVFGEVLHESCTGGLRFSRELQTCDWPRNVDCPQLAANNSSSSGSTSASSVASTTLSNQMPTTTMQSVASSSSSQFPTTTPGSLLLRDRSPSSESQANTSESSLRSASLVFADEGSDPQQPSFDEAVSPVITADGNIHLHDGSGGTFSLQPDHGAVPPGPTTRSLGGGQSVDVFVKPLSVGQQQQQRARQQQVVVGSNNANRAQKLQPASLPNVGQHRNLIQLANKQTSSPQTTTSTMSGRFASDLDSETESADVADSPDSSADSQVDPSGDSIGTQADQEAANENSDGSAASQADSEQDNSRQSSSSTASSSSGYIPPVMGSQGSLLISRPTNSNNNNNNNRQQSSQLLSINSRQSISQNQFKPITVTNQVSANNGLASNRQQHQQSMSIGDNNGNFNNNNNKFGLGQQRPRLQEQPPVDDGGEEEEDSTPPTRTSSPVAVTASAPRAIGNQLRQINQTFSLNQQQQMNLIAQNNRQSRMSTGNFQQQFNNNQNNNILHAGNLQLANLDRSRFLSTPASSNNVNNNNNFNDSKLIRLPAATSHFEEPGEPTLLSSSHSFSPKFPLPSAAGQQQRSQQSSVLSQQQPSFGFNEPASGLRNEQPSRANLLSEPDAPLQAVLLQQQRRPRPPKRQQIPTGHNRANVNQNLRGQPDEEPAILTSTELPQTSGFSSSFGPAISGSDELATTGRSSQFSRQSTRPLVAPTTLNFQQDGFSTPSSLLMSSQADRTGRQFEAGNRFVAGNQGHSSTTTSGSRNQLLSSSTLGGEQPKMATTGLPSVSAAGDPNVPSNSDNNNNNQQPADPQMVANRYLNSAIDALEAGQPFGTVDYDFDILDNSTEHRRPISPSTGAGQSQTSTPSSSASSSSPSTPAAGSASSSTAAAAAVVANRQRTTLANNNGFQRTGQAAGGLEGEHGPGENIDLTNGQPNIGQIGLNLRPQQQQQRAAQSSAANRQQAGTGSGGQQFSNVNLNIGSQANGQESFQQQVGSSNNLAGQRDSSLAPSSPTKKPRPTNKKIQVNHEQALVNNRASIEPAKRPEALFTTPTPLQTASKCDNRHCRLPDCKCGDTLTPQGMEPKLIPQVVLLTFDDAVNDLNWEIYEELFTGRVNPNGCPILATFYVSHEWTDYGQVQTLYSRGHEMASHSITHSFGEKFSKSQWFKEVNGQREILNMYGGVKMNDVRGMRAPFLQIGGNKMFEMLYDANFTYDSSMPIFENSPPLWPYTLDYQLNHECMITPCPTKSFPGVWEVGMTMWVDLRGGRCSMGDACTNPPDEDGVYDMLMKNFNRHYKSNRAPFGLFYHSAWFNTVHHRRGFLRFMSTLNSLPDVFFVTNWQMLQWMRQPTPLSEINNFEPWQCPAKNDRPPPCFHPSVCNVKSEHGTRFMKTCQPCPSNQQYPWVGSTGFKSKQANGSG